VLTEVDELGLGGKEGLRIQLSQEDKLSDKLIILYPAGAPHAKQQDNAV